MLTEHSEVQEFVSKDTNNAFTSEYLNYPLHRRRHHLHHQQRVIIFCYSASSWLVHPSSFFCLDSAVLSDFNVRSCHIFVPLMYSVLWQIDHPDRVFSLASHCFCRVDILDLWNFHDSCLVGFVLVALSCGQTMSDVLSAWYRPLSAICKQWNVWTWWHECFTFNVSVVLCHCFIQFSVKLPSVHFE